jgi:branched-chain amino acid transport system substrate-binding protein
MRGVTPTEIGIGQTMPYSGPVSAFGALGKGERPQDHLMSLDNGYTPPKTVEQTRRLLQSDEVALIFCSLETARNAAIARYLQGKNINRSAEVAAGCARKSLHGIAEGLA